MEPNEFVRKMTIEFSRELETTWDKLPGGMFNPLESMVLYSLVRATMPKNVLEIGSLNGKTTCLIQQALEYNGRGKFTTCDLETKSPIAKRNVDALFPNNKVRFISGEVQNNLDKLDSSFDVVFIDGPHTEEFMQWCVDNIISRVKKGGMVMIHDINLSFNWNYRDTPGCETECLIKLEVDGKLPIGKLVWLEDWCLNHHMKQLRNSIYEDFPRAGKWGILNDPEMNTLSIWFKK